jgi:hypothetical protein
MPFLSYQSARKNSIKEFSCALFCPLGQNELDINKYDAQIPIYIIEFALPEHSSGQYPHSGM